MSEKINSNSNTNTNNNNNNNEQNSSMKNEKQERMNPEGIVEMSENHRYIRFQEIIRITFNGLLTSYKAFDTTDGVEIAWHKISIPEINEEEKIRFDQFMYDLNHNLPNHKDYFVENLSYWFSVESPNEQHYLNIITTNYETIREFISKVKTLRWKIVKKWCRQLLQALACLQQHDPPIIHRYLSCSHIYIDSGLGTITVGDIWLSFQSNAFNLANSVNDTTRPNFDDPQGDVYAFGLCALEMISRESNSRKKSIQPTLFTPEYISSTLTRVTNEQAREFIELCLLPSDSRSTVSALQNHPFLSSAPFDEEEVKLGPPMKLASEGSLASLDFPSRERLDSEDNNSNSSGKFGAPSTPLAVEHTKVSQVEGNGESESTKSKVEGIAMSSNTREAQSSIRVVSVTRTAQSSREYQFQLSIPANLFQQTSNATDKEVEFLLDFDKDDVKAVATEMIDELQLIVSMEELAVEIENTVKVQEDQSKPPTTSLLTRINSHDQAQQQLQQQQQLPSPVQQAPSPQLIAQPTLSTSSLPPPPPPIQPPSPNQHFQSASVSPMFFNKSISEDETSFKKVPSNPNLVGLNSTNPSINILPSASSLLTVESIARSSPITHAPSPSKQQTAPVTTAPAAAATPSGPVPANPFPLVKTSSKVLEEETDINNSSNNSTTRARANSNVSIEENLSRKEESNSSKIYSTTDFSADIILQKLLERIDQEARAARRAFDTRIQKLISTQEKCEEDLSKLKNDLQNKMNEYDKKEEALKQKKDVELHKIKNEFELKVKELRAKLKAESLQQQQAQQSISHNQLQSINVQSSSSSLSLSSNTPAIVIVEESSQSTSSLQNNSTNSSTTINDHQQQQQC